MAKLLFAPIGEPRARAPGEESWARQLAHVRALGAALQAQRDVVRAGWGEKYAARVREKGKLTTWERVERLKDADSPLLPIGTLVGHGRQYGPEQRTAPGAGVLTAFARVSGRWAVIIANDNTVASGSWWPQTPEKIQRAQEIALRLRLPVIYLVDCSGLFLPEQSHTFPGRSGAGAIFRSNALLSAAGVPQVAGVHGDCIAGGGYMPIISDVVYMTEQAYMVIAGAALIKGAKSRQLTSLAIGGPDVHVHLSRCADYRVPDDVVLLRKLREELAKLPGPACDYYRYGTAPAPPRLPAAELDGMFPVDHRMAYDMRQVLARLVDDSLFWEALPEAGPEMICGVGRIDGLYVGLIANNPALTDHPVDRAHKRPGGILYREGIAKISQFSRSCNDDGIPLVWLQDISGFDIGIEAEAQGLLGYGSNLIYTNSTNTVPMITVLLRKASGAGYYAMAGMPYRPVLQLATPLTRLSVMEGRTLAIGAFRTKLDDEFNIVADSAEEAERIRQGMAEVEARITADMDPLLAAAQQDVDEIVTPGELRGYLEAIVAMCYQATGYRRVKNPRIWSLHDLDALLP
ncbi:MAG TPA: carboxyl transferase domain-containing protein [Candidatus Polarisedimenticolaceae bacterium]|nr:carboxyl transferase domain-containing protein [Candidatus Polarisedimenticolaceae bacterium]